MSYQDRDAEIVDYELFTWPGLPVELRGPRPAIGPNGDHIACVGAAQTFGCFCARPWPTLLAERLGIPTLNLGVAGAGPRYFRTPSWLNAINASRLAVIQVMSGRSEDNAVFESGGLEVGTRRADQSRLGAEAAWQELFDRGVAAWPAGLARRFANRVLGIFGRRHIRALVAETRRNWVASCVGLLDSIEVPTVLLWISKRAPDYRPNYRNVWNTFGEFPQLVDADMISAVREHADHYVECKTSRGSPQPLISRHTGLPTTVEPGAARADLAVGPAWTHNHYYPSPEMHEDAADALLPVLQRTLGDR